MISLEKEFVVDNFDFDACYEHVVEEMEKIYALGVITRASAGVERIVKRYILKMYPVHYGTEKKHGHLVHKFSKSQKNEMTNVSNIIARLLYNEKDPERAVVTKHYFSSLQDYYKERYPDSLQPAQASNWINFREP